MTTTRGASIGHILVGGAAIVFLAVGAIGPWLTLGILSRNGLDGGGDGWVMLFIAAMAALVLWRYVTAPRRRQGWWLALEGAIAVAAGISDINTVQNRHGSIFGVELHPSVGWGLYLAVAAGAVIALVGVSIARTTASAEPIPATVPADDDPVIVHPEDSVPYPDEDLSVADRITRRGLPSA